MFSTLETIAIIGIIIVQLIIAVHAYWQIDQMKSFLPKERTSLLLKEYEIPASKILELNPSDIVDKITYTPSKVEEEVIDSEPLQDIQPRDEKGRFTSKRTGYSPILGDVNLDDEGLLPY